MMHPYGLDGRTHGQHMCQTTPTPGETTPSPARRGWFRKLRRTAVAATIAIAALAVATVSLTSLPTWPIVGVACLAVATAVNTIASRLSPTTMTCFECGSQLDAQKAGTYGVVCGSCGTINQPYVVDANDAPASLLPNEQDSPTGHA